MEERRKDEEISCGRRFPIALHPVSRRKLSFVFAKSASC
jgi:hypothetical protein